MQSSKYPVQYLYKEHKVTKMPYFLYEVNIYKTSKNMASILNSKFYKSNTLINIKNDEIILERTKDYCITKSIDIVGVPEDFIKEYDLKVYEPKKKSIVIKKPVKKKKRK